MKSVAAKAEKDAFGGDGDRFEGPLALRPALATALGTFREKEDTVHRVYNRTDAPAVALVCDIARAE